MKAVLGTASLGAAVIAAAVHGPVLALDSCIGAGGGEIGGGCPAVELLAQSGRGTGTSVDVAVLPADPPTSTQINQTLASSALQPSAAGTQVAQARAWMHNGSVAVGLGVDMPLVGAAMPGQGRVAADGVRAVLAMRADVSPNARMSFERVGRRLESTAPSPVFNADSSGATDSSSSRLGLEFKSPKRSAQMPLGTLRFQVSSASTLSLRPRSGGMAVSYRSTF